MIINSEQVHPNYKLFSEKKRQVLSPCYEDNFDLQKIYPEERNLKSINKLFGCINAFLLGLLLVLNYYLWSQTNLTRKDFLAHLLNSTYRTSENEQQIRNVAKILDYIVKTQENQPDFEDNSKSVPTDLDDKNLIISKEPNIGTVETAKANLRSEPSLNSPILMVIANSSKLTIEEENGDWYRVTAPNGERAWISKKVLSVTTNG